MRYFSFLLAYADPGTGMLLWQIITAFCLGFAFYFKNFLKKLFSFIKSKKIKKDE
ncbi:MAG: hypothetical protein WCT85_01720 [Parachlamydiales bacterium]|jgi:hypothetical protein